MDFAPQPGGVLVRHRAFGWARKGFNNEEWLPARDSDVIYRIGAGSFAAICCDFLGLIAGAFCTWVLQGPSRRALRLSV